MKTGFLFALLSLYQIKSFSQVETLKDVIVKNDTTYEANNIQKNATFSHPYIDTGMIIKAFQNPYRIALVSEKKDNISSGIYLSFYLVSNMPKIRGWYTKGEKDADWYYWDEQGNLLRKEIWEKGKLITTIVKCSKKK